MNYKFEYTLKEEDYKNFTSLAGRNTLVLTAFVILGAAGFVLNKTITEENMPINDALIYLIPFGLLVLLAVFYFTVVKKMVAKQTFDSKDFYKEKRTVTFDDKKICEKYKNHNVTVDAKSVKKIIYNKKLVAVYTGPKEALIIPTSAFENENHRKQFIEFVNKFYIEANR